MLVGVRRQPWSLLLTFQLAKDKTIPVWLAHKLSGTISCLSPASGHGRASVTDVHTTASSLDVDSLDSNSEPHIRIARAFAHRVIFPAVIRE